MQRLLNGIRSVNEKGLPFSTEGLAKGQSPEVLLVTCSDSRIVPHAVTDAGPGEVFVVRNAGNMLPDAGTGSSEEGTIEYGLRALKIPHLIVCGHTHCGAMKGLLDGVDLAAVASWLKAAEEARDRVLKRKDVTDKVNAVIEENVLVQLERARRYPAVKEAVEAGRLKLHGWIYDIETAAFRAYDENEKAFLPLAGDVRRSA